MIRRVSMHSAPHVIYLNPLKGFLYSMAFNSLGDILPLLERPSRYLGSETNTIRKDLSQVALRMVLAFPDLYEIGTSHFGLQILYHILNSQAEICAERVFAPSLDLEAHLRSSDLPLCSLENRTPLHHFDIIGFSLLYELNYTNVLTIMDLAKIPFYQKNRTRAFPFIIAGGPCTVNPEPVADFFDAMVIGDGERVVLEMAHAWLAWKIEGDFHNKKDLLLEWSKISGVYIPSLFKCSYSADVNILGLQTIVPVSADYFSIRRAIVNDFDRTFFPDAPIVPFGHPIHDRLRLEIARGCSRGCRFCQAGMIYRPVRERSLATLIKLAKDALAATGYEDLSLLSLSSGDYNLIGPLLSILMESCAPNHISISLPSLRAGTLTPELIKLIKKVRKTGFTIAPEAGSQKLRNHLNKNLTDQEIIDTVEDVFRLGWLVIKLYFMIGLPLETQTDLDKMVDLIKVLNHIKRKTGSKPTRKQKRKINVSIGTFIPKSHTPFQWASQLSLQASQEKLAWLRDQLNLSGVQIKTQRPEMSFLEGLFARGDRRLGLLLVNAYKNGCRFDGWNDHLQFNLWRKSIDQTDIDIDFYTTRQRSLVEPLPWDHIDAGVSKAFLTHEWNKCMTGEETSDCRHGNCNQCGVCDFKIIKPEITTSQTIQNFNPPDRTTQFAAYQLVKVTYAKLNSARFFGHLELVKIFFRALRRAQITVKYTQGFHPKPKISFENPLPIGIESLSEHFYMAIEQTIDPHAVIVSLNKQLPSGLTARDCQPVKNIALPTGLPAVYTVKLETGFFDELLLQNYFSNLDQFYLHKNVKGKQKMFALNLIVSQIKLLAPDTIKLILKSSQGKIFRPFEILSTIFKLSDLTLKRARILKL
jgi:radical SAM family uncharacterized protein/radical SAM-linked protein